MNHRGERTAACSVTERRRERSEASGVLMRMCSSGACDLFGHEKYQWRGTAYVCLCVHVCVSAGTVSSLNHSMLSETQTDTQVASFCGYETAPNTRTLGRRSGEFGADLKECSWDMDFLLVLAEKELPSLPRNSCGLGDKSLA